jgi:TolB-like protein/class 3 adenylate cyclase/Tfp pilus assembly protein PilF
MRQPGEPVAEQHVQRRLAAILAADVAGYSRLMGADEEGTLRRLNAHRRELVDPKIAEHRGRIVKTTGDGMLVEFASVVDAVRCAAEVQRAMAERDADLPDEERIRFRVGVNLGDIIVEGDDIFGDGVNVAARLEALAEPGGICVSRTVRNQVRDKLPYSFDDMGEQQVKNIARPVRADAMSAAAVAATPLVAVQAPSPPPPRRSTIPRSAVIAASVVAAIGIGLAAWWVWPHAGPSPASVQAPAAPQPPAAAASPVANPAPRLSIVVLPFANLSNDPDQEYFADGVTDDLTTDLSHIVDSFVIARTTAFTYKGKAVDVKQIGHDLGVRYVLEGSVRRDGEKVQINVQLIDAESGAHIWADRFDTARADLAKAQDEIVGRLAQSLQRQIVEAATRRMELAKPVNPDASDYVMRGWAWFNRPRNTAALLEAQRAFERALEIDPQSVEAKTGLAMVVSEFVVNGRSHVVDGVNIPPEQDMARAEQLLLEAIDRDRDNPRALWAMGRLRRVQGHFSEAKIELEKAIALNRNDSTANLQLGITLTLMGQPEAAIPHIETAIRLNPQSQNVSFYYYWLGHAHLLLGHANEAVDILRKARAADPRVPWLLLAAALGFRGDVDEAKAIVAESLKLKPQSNSLAKLHALPLFRNASPEFVALHEKTVDVGLRRAGLPDE